MLGSMHSAALKGMPRIQEEEQEHEQEQEEEGEQEEEDFCNPYISTIYGQIQTPFLPF